MRLFILGAIALLIIGCNGYSKKDYTSEVEYLKKQSVRKDYNDKYGILIDYSISSKYKRLSIVDLKTKEIVKRFHVAHGKGKGQKRGVPLGFSNVSGSYASSLGLAVIGPRDYSNHGINVKYWLKGLDKTNSNIERRIIVIHSSNWITNTDFKLFPITQSLGCPTISNTAMRYLDKLIQSQDNKKILVYTFN